MKNVIKIRGSAEMINEIISQVKVINEEEEKQIKYLGRNEYSMIGMDFSTVPDPFGGEVIDLIISAENPLLLYKLGLYTASVIGNLIK